MEGQMSEYIEYVNDDGKKRRIPIGIGDAALDMNAVQQNTAAAESLDRLTHGMSNTQKAEVTGGGIAGLLNALIERFVPAEQRAEARTLIKNTAIEPTSHEQRHGSGGLEDSPRMGSPRSSVPDISAASRVEGPRRSSNIK
jgi:hypothetical protein